MKFKLWIRTLTVLMAILMTVASLPVYALADGGEESDEPEVYIKSVMLSQSGSKSEAKKELESAGYIFLDENLNEGTGEDGVYLGYTTTTDPSEAIYDMKLMNMNGGYTLTSMEQALKQQKTVLTSMAKDLMLLIDEFAEAYEQGSVAAQKAYKALNFFRTVENESVPIESNGLGYQLARKNLSLEELTEIILFCDTEIVDSVVQILVMGIQARNENWLEKLSEAGPYDSNANYGDDDEELRRRAEELLPVLGFYAKAYNAMDAKGIVSGTFNENMEIEGAQYKPGYEIEASDGDVKNLDVSRYQVYKIAFDHLDTYSYGSGTLKDFFCSLEDATNEKLLYPLLSVISDGEFAALSYGCVLDVILGADTVESDFSVYDEVYADMTNEISSIYLYAGVDDVLLHEDTIVAFTEEASRHMAATGEMEFYENESRAEDKLENGKLVAKKIAAGGLLVMAGAKIVLVGFMLAKWTFNASALIAIGGKFGAAAKFFAMLSGGKATLVLYAVVLLTYAISYLVYAIYDWIDNDIDWGDYPVPEYIYDVREVNRKQTSDDGIETDYVKRPAFVLYEAVRDAQGKPVDLNVFSDDSRQWLTMYVSYDVPGEGAKPIKASDLLVKTGNGETPEGYTPLCEFGEVVAKDLNSYDGTNAVNGIYMFYRQDTKAVVESGRTYYVSDVYLQAGESPEHCIGLLEDAGYTPINVNLSPNYSGQFVFDGDMMYSYIGYKTTTNKNNALRDIRMSYGMLSSPLNYGGASYAECGTSAGVTLYASKYASTGTPILAGSLKVTSSRYELPVGYEPVNFFTGGPAMSFNTYDGTVLGTPLAQYYLYFLPETSFSDEGERYLGGITYVYADVADIMNTVSFDSDIKNWIYDSIKDVSEEEYTYASEQTLLYAVRKYVNLTTGLEIKNTKRNKEEGFVTYSTYNPYRAIYGIKATKIGSMPMSITVSSQSYVAISDIQSVTRKGPIISNPLGATYIGYDVNASDAIVLDALLYLAGNPSGNTYNVLEGKMSDVQPLKITDVIIAGEKTGGELIPKEETGYVALDDAFFPEGEAMTIKNANAPEGYVFYVLEEDKEELPYVGEIYVKDTASIYRDYGGAEKGIDKSMISPGLALSSLAGSGATHFCSEVPTFYGWINNADVKKEFEVNRVYFGYSKTDQAGKGYTDMFLYYGGIGESNAPSELYRGSVKYSLVSEISAYNFSGIDDNIVPRIYLYATTSKKAGERIIDFTVSKTPFLEGYETVRSYSGGSLWADILTELEEAKKSQPHYIGSGIIDRWLDFFTINDDEDHGRWNSGIYLHFKREGSSIEQQKPYIAELFIETADGDNVNGICERLFAAGADGYVKKDLNAGTIGDTVYIGYKLTSDPTEAITDIRASHSKNHQATKTDSNNVEYSLVSADDLNLGCGFWSDYIYLYYTKDSKAGDPIIAIEASNKIHKASDDAKETVKRWNSDDASDLNDGAAGEYIYLNVTRKANAAEGSYEAPDYGKNKTYTRKDVEGSKEGAYIAALYVMDKNTIRNEKIAAGEKSVKCSDISDDEVVQKLFEMGAAYVIETPLLSVGKEYSGFDTKNANKVFIGYSRTDNARQAIKGVVLNTVPISEDEPEETIYVNKKSYKLVAGAATKVEELPPAINLIGLEGAQDTLSTRIYLYTTTSGTDPIYDIMIDTVPLVSGWHTALSQNGKEAFADLHEQYEALKEKFDKEGDAPYVSANFTNSTLSSWCESYAKLFDPANRQISSWYIHTKNYAEESLSETKPYIGKLFVASGKSKEEAMINLLSNTPDEFIDVNLNKDAGGKYVYLAYTRTDNKTFATGAITKVVVFENTAPQASQLVSMGNSGFVRYDIAGKVNLNDGAGGKKLYLYTTKDKAAGGPIRNLSIVEDAPLMLVEDNISWDTVCIAKNSGYTMNVADLNKDAGGKKLYLVTEREIGKVDSMDNLLATLQGGGSLVAVAIFVTLSIGGAALLIYKKKVKTQKE